MKKYLRRSPALDDITCIYNHKTCLVAKNHKHGGLYIHPTGEIIEGKFFKSSGSIRHPVLQAETKEVHIKFENFPYNPNNIHTDQYVKQDIISIVDLIEQE
jgi:hypothetical protein